MTKKQPKPKKSVAGPVKGRRPALRDNPLARREQHPIVDLLKPQLATPSTGSLQDSTVASSLATVSPSVASSLATDSTDQLATHSKSKLAKRPNQKISYQSRNLITVGVRLSIELNKQINDFCFRKNIEKQEFFQEAASYALNLPDAELATVFTKSVASQLAHDDMMTYQTHDDIIMRYERYTSQKWTRRDDREGIRYNGTDIRLIEIAFVLTIERKLRGNTAKQPIKSFNYFSQEIDLLVDQKTRGELPSALDDYHRYVCTVWETRILPLRNEKWKIEKT